ncbi:TetR/AcrR family transcriptional regulator [Nisaea sediminum]|uniref:TetR/AcrR family transcriptional regulator n=1 Tax=Nisaea sediminum TaxID=2775867 RepID=UPI00186696CC|nr:TetR/AcrR family transcriptional regulator [Nisaea sediminum]
MSRPRKFCEEAALEKALEEFWRAGYEGTSISRLTEVMGINRPSLYATFGNKEELFQKSVARYVAMKNRYIDEALKAPTAREMVERLLYDSADILTDDCHPLGCMAVQSALAVGDNTERVRQEMVQIREAFSDRIRKRFEEECRDGRLPPGTDPEVLAQFISTVQHGMSVQASSGASREQLRKVVEMAMRAWPA